MNFEWDTHNQNKNWDKHQVATHEAEEVFEQGLFLGPTKCGEEERFAVIGRIKSRRTLLVIYTMREEKIRVISARDASRKERKLYEEKNKKTSKV